LQLCGEVRFGEEGDQCRGEGSCASPLICNAAGSCVQGGEGTAAQGEPCERGEQCRFGLICGVEGLCTDLPKWSGVSCGAARMEGAPHLLFEIPRGAALEDFYRLPHPNDIRLRGGLQDLQGFPGLVQEREPGEIISRYLSALSEEEQGFSPNSAILFRFSGPLDFETLRFGGDDPSFVFVDVTPGSDALGRRPRSRFFATTDRARYICHNWLGIRPSEGSPLESGHSYAVYFLKGIKDDKGQLLEAGEDFRAMLAEEPQEHPALRAAWQRYAPLREWIQAEEGIGPDDLIGGTVFTVGDPLQHLSAVYSAALSENPPVVMEEVLCDGGSDSPCEEGGARTCGEVNELYSEIHLRLRGAHFLRGGSMFFKEGRPQQQSRQPFCAAVTLPRGAAPQGGWPLLLFAHDTGGHFRSFVRNGLATRLARLGWAVMSWDRVGHREGSGSPEEIAAALEDPSQPQRYRDQPLQDVADMAILTRLFSQLQVKGDGGRQGFNPEQLAFFGQGRGGEAGILFLAQDDLIRAVVLTGVGGGIVDQLQFSQAPVNLASLSQSALADSELNGMHPGLHLMQNHLDSRDPLNFARFLRNPQEGFSGKHLFILDGAGDGITPLKTRSALAIAARLEQLGQGSELLESVPLLEATEVQGNIQHSSGRWTQILKQYLPDEGDGHAVAFSTQAAIADLNEFFSSLLSDPEGIPKISL